MTTYAVPRTTRWWRHWLGGWSHVVFMVLDVAVAFVGLLVLVLLGVGMALIPALLLGVVLVAPALWLAETIARWERHRVEAFTGRVVLPPPELDLPTWRRYFLNPVRWKATAYLALQCLWGSLAGGLVTGILCEGLAFLSFPFLTQVTPAGSVTALELVTVTPGFGAGAAVVLGLLALVLAPVIARILTHVDVQLAWWLIGRDPGLQIKQLADRVDTLTQSRAATVDSVEAERRRIERDLHDGPQQRLVSIAIDVGMARDALARDPEAARELLEHAHQSSKEAIAEIRQVARGIVPPILTDRGLDAALSAIAARMPIPVDVEVRGVDRLDPSIEAIAYFSVSEALTNVAKHAHATAARVVVDPLAPRAVGGRSALDAPDAAAVVLTIADDGIGGADPARGTGLAGLRQRVGSVDGSLEVSSPPGGPTTVTIMLPVRPPGGPR